MKMKSTVRRVKGTMILSMSLAARAQRQRTHMPSAVGRISISSETISSLKGITSSLPVSRGPAGDTGEYTGHVITKGVNGISR